MTGWGKKLAGVDEEQLRQQLRTETGPKEVKRLTAALLYADGSSPYEIERLLGFPAQTVYDWLDTVAERDRRARRLSSWRQFFSSHRRPVESTDGDAAPSEAGIDPPAWRPPLVRDYIAEQFDVELLFCAHVSRDEKGRAVRSDSPADPLRG